MKKIVPVSFLVDDLSDTLFLHNPQHIPDVTEAVKHLMDAAYRVYFLSLPNPGQYDWFELAVQTMDTRLRLVYSNEWYVGVYECCMRWLERYFNRWDDVHMSTKNDIMKFISHGDYRIRRYHELFGACRVGDEIVRETKHVDDITDPFYVSDTIECEQSVEALNVTATSMVSAFSKIPDYLRLERAGTAITGLRGLPRGDLLRAQELANSKPTRIPPADRRRVGESEQEWLQRMGEQGQRLLKRHLSHGG